jgi:hypothetical protein
MCALKTSSRRLTSVMIGARTPKGRTAAVRVGDFHGEAHTSHSWVRVGDTTLVSRTRTSMTTCRRYIRADLVDIWGSSVSKMTDN